MNGDATRPGLVVDDDPGYDDRERVLAEFRCRRRGRERDDPALSRRNPAVGQSGADAGGAGGERLRARSDRERHGDRRHRHELAAAVGDDERQRRIASARPQRVGIRQQRVRQQRVVGCEDVQERRPLVLRHDGVTPPVIVSTVTTASDFPAYEPTTSVEPSGVRRMSVVGAFGTAGIVAVTVNDEASMTVTVPNPALKTVAPSSATATPQHSGGVPLP